tara:strand:+ start:363 stop:1490 length:1128 start_codon:yes stop_codon:yes gene_type:complete
MEATFKIAKAKTQLMLRQPFFGSIAMSLPFIEDTEIDTMATDGKKILFNPSFVDKHSLDEIKGVVAHEVMHVALQHPLRIGERQHRLWNMATDYAINQIVIDSGLSLPDCGLLDSKFKGLAAETIYSRLLEDPPEESEDGTDSWDFGKIIEPQGDDGQALSESEKSMLSDEISVMVIQAHSSAKMQGKVPAGIDDLINQLTESKVNWDEKLWLFFSGSRPEDYTWRTPNRKMYGAYNIYMPSMDRKGIGHIVIAIDSSCSVSSADLSKFLSEMNAISEQMGAESITVICCDTKIQSVKTFEAGEIIEEINAKGRGGTRVAPVFKHIEENDLPCDALVYFTDLYVSDFPDAPDYPVLWVTTGDTQAPFGEVVRALL